MNKFLQLSAYEILGLTIIGEARGEPIEGQVAVGCVVRNRLHAKSGQQWHDICLAPKQFSCWNENDPNFVILTDLTDQLLDGQPIRDIYLRQCMYIARGIIDWEILDNTNGSKNYVTTKLFNSQDRPKWALYPSQDPIIYGRQTFFNV